MQEEIPRFHGILRNIRGGDEGERWGERGFFGKKPGKKLYAWDRGGYGFG